MITKQRNNDTTIQHHNDTTIQRGNFFRSLFRCFVVSLFSLVLVLITTNPVLAQSSLDNIKAKLEGEGIAVIDYSSPQGQWGSLPKEWITFFTPTYPDGIKGLAKDFETNFTGPDSITDLRRRLGVAISEKNSLTLQKDLDAKNKEIDDLQTSLKNAEEDAKSAIANLIKDVPFLDKEKGVNVIFSEIDFYYNYHKWAQLPTRLITVLEGAGYDSLQNLIEVAGGADKVKATLTPLNLNEGDVSLITDSLALLSGTGEGQINEIARNVANTIKNIIFGLAIIWLVIAGIRMIFAQGDETIIKEQKKAIIYVMLGLVVILLVGRMIDFLYGPAGVTRMALTPDQGFNTEVYGIINFIKALIGMVAIVFIVMSGVKMLFAVGEEAEIKKEKTAILWVGVGLVLIAVNEVIIRNFFIIPTQQQSDQIRTSNITAVINTIGRVFQFGLGFVGLIAFGALVYGAASMIINYGNDEMVTKAKKVITNAIIGIMVILSAYVIVATLIIFR